MQLFFKTLRARLFVWYISTLILFALFFYFVIHIFALPYGNELFFFLFLLLASLGYYLVYRITRSITYLTTQIGHISRKNLAERVTEITTEDEIGELARAFNGLLDTLDKAFKREQQFIGDVAHELKTPLAIQRSTLEVTLAKDRSKEAYQKALEEVLQQNATLSATIEEVLDLAWSETHEDTRQHKQFNLSELLEELGDIAEKKAQEKKLTITTSIEEGVMLSGFKKKLARAFLNLIDNAIKYTEQGTISLQLRVVHNHAEIVIADTGIGIPQKELANIFTRFYRGEHTKHIAGTGLGLAITKSVITLHHGHISVTSKPTKGTIITMLLPLASSSFLNN